MLYNAELVERDLWRQFCIQQNEMIITKAGRCLFPLFRVRLSPMLEGSESKEIEVENDREYRVLISMEAMDENKWKWRQGRWVPLLTSRALGRREEEPCRTLVCHESLRGKELVQGGLNFDKVKLTNRDDEAPMTICLQSFHRYIPVIHIIERQDPFRVQVIKLTETEFIAVTHYQNEQVTILKKSYNPHAKGFVINEEVPAVGTTDWLLTPDFSSPAADGGGEEGGEGRKQRRARKRIRPVTFDAIPSDEEELQGSIALQNLGGRREGC